MLVNRNRGEPEALFTCRIRYNLCFQKRRLEKLGEILSHNALCFLIFFVYEFISHSHFHLWELEKKFLNLMGVHFLHNLLINPLLGFVFLSRFPSNSKNRIFYYAKWMVLFLAAEWIAHRIGIITYHNGWNIWWSLLFVFIMLTIIRLHYVHKRMALFLSLMIAAIYLFLFDYL